jgi:hypothetical protein
MLFNHEKWKKQEAEGLGQTELLKLGLGHLLPTYKQLPEEADEEGDEPRFDDEGDQ